MVPGIELTLGGTAYLVPPLSLGAIERFQDALKKPPTPSLVIDVATASLRRNYPDMTRDAVAELIDTANCAIVFDAIMGVSALAAKANAPGEAKAARARRR